MADIAAEATLIDAKLDEAVELFTKRRYVAEKQPDSERHVELPGDLVKVPDDADAVSIGVERAYEASKTEARAEVPKTRFGTVLHAKVRVELSLDGGQTFSPRPDGRQVWPWGMYPISFSVGAEKDPLQPDPDSQWTSWPQAALPAGSGRVLRVFFVPLQDVDARVVLFFEAVNGRHI